MRQRHPALPLPLLLLLLAIAAGCRRQDTGELVISGRIEVDDSQVGSKIGGRVEQVNADEGDVVKRGAVLVRLDDNELRAQLAQAQASAGQALAQLNLLLAGSRKEDIEQAEATVAARRADLELRRKGFRKQEVGQAQAELEAAQTQLALTRKEYERAQQLIKEEVIGQQELDTRRTAFNNAQAQVNQAQERLSLFQSGSRPEEISSAEAQLRQSEAELLRLKNGPRPEEIAAQRAAVEAARASIQRIQAQLDETRILAPLDAMVETMELHPGDLIRAGEPVATLDLLTRPWVRAYLPENRLGWTRPGQEVTIMVDSFPGRRFRGRVRRVNNVAEFTPRNVQTTEKRAEQVFEIKVDVLEGGEQIRPGMYADVHIPLPKAAAR